MTSQSRKEAAIEFLKLAASGKLEEAYGRHVGAGFRHHNPYFRGDAFEGDLIVELWDVGQPIPGSSTNEYGMV